MDLALGLKAHSGWAALVAAGLERGALRVADRARVELVDGKDEAWAKQPSHAAEGLPADKARDLVRRATAGAGRLAARELRAAVGRAREAGHSVVACAVLVGEPMPAWTVEQILAVHFRMHQAEGALFRDALAHAAEACGLRFVAVPEKAIEAQAARALAKPAAALRAAVAAVGKAVGPPWGKDQKDAALAAWVALRR